MDKKQSVVIAIMIAVALALGAAILFTEPQAAGDEHGHAEATGHADAEHHGGSSEAGHKDTAGHADEEHHGEGEATKGPHGGRLFVGGAYGLEVTIFETGVDPQFRLYMYKDGKPLDPAQSKVTLTLQRLGREPQRIEFTREADYLKGDAVVEEPHSFQVQVDANHAGRAYRFAYEQVEARVRLSDEQLKQSGVDVLTAGPARIKSTRQLIGEIRLNQDRAVQVVPRLAGIVESVPVSAGDQVRKGQVLAVISSQTFADQRSELSAAEKRFALAKTMYEREKQLWEEKITAEQDYLQARQAMQEASIALQSARQKVASLRGAPAGGNDFTRYEVRSPIDGTVAERHVSIGEVLKEDANIFVIADLSSVWAEVVVHPRDFDVAKVGQQVTVKANDFDSRSEGRIAYVSALVGEQTRTATARVVLPNPQGAWRPGLPVSVELVAEEAEVPLAVSLEALQTVRDWTAVFARHGEQLEARPLELGRRDDRFVEVLDGLQAGERYAAKNSFLIKADLEKSGASHDH